MLPTSNIGIGALSLPQLPPSPSGPNPTAPGQFGRLYDRLLTAEEQAPRGLPTAMEVAPLISPASTLAQPFKPSVEFPGAVDPNATGPVGADGLRLPGVAKSTSADGALGELFKPFQEGLAQVNKLQHDSRDLANEAAIGGDVDLHDVMIASEKASVSMQLTMAIRNKLVESYQEIMRMQV